MKLTLCVLAFAVSVSADNGERCLRSEDNIGWEGVGGSIQVMSAFYGLNCGARFRGNVTWHVQQACNGQQTCWYQVNHHMLGDPAYGCHKDFRVNYSCGDGQMRQAYLWEEASGQTLMLSCH